MLKVEIWTYRQTNTKTYSLWRKKRRIKRLERGPKTCWGCSRNEHSLKMDGNLHWCLKRIIFLRGPLISLGMCFKCQASMKTKGQRICLIPESFK